MMRGLQERLAAFEAEAIVSRAVGVSGRRQVVEVLDGWDAAGLKEIGSAIAARPGHVAVLFTAASPANVVVARAGDVQLDAAGVLRSLTTAFGGKGGGRAEFAQGGGLAGDPARMIEVARSLL